MAAGHLQKQNPLPSNDENCSIHPQRKAAFFCLEPTCQHGSVCLNCVSTVHRGHELEKVTTFIANMETFIKKQIQIGKEENLKPLTKEIEFSEKMMEKSKNDSHETQQKILERKNELESEIEKLTEWFIRSCRTAEMRNKRKLNHHKEKLKNREHNLKDVVNRFEDALSALSYLDVNQLHLLTEFPLQPHRSSFPKLCNFEEFQPISIPDTTNHIEHVYGIYLKQSSSDHELHSFQMETPHNKIKLIHPLLDQLCVWSWNDKHVSLVNRKGLITHTITLHAKSKVETDNNYDEQEDEEGRPHTEELDFDISDLTISPTDNTVWFCCSDGVVRQITSCGESRDRIYTARNPLALCVCSTGEIIVGFVDCISEYQSNGKQVKTRDLDKLEEQAKKVFFGCPRSISSCSKTRHIAVLGFVDVFVLNSELNLLWAYRTTLQKEKICDAASVFAPETICQDADGRVIIADRCQKTIYAIDTSRDVMQSDSLKDLYPTAMCIVEDNTAWLAFTSVSGKVSFQQVKLPAY